MLLVRVFELDLPFHLRNEHSLFFVPHEFLRRVPLLFVLRAKNLGVVLAFFKRSVVDPLQFIFVRASDARLSFFVQVLSSGRRATVELLLA